MHHATMLTVGAFSRASGLPVSALRYYDAAGVLRPAHVDPVTGYRWYTPDQVGRASLVAQMRQTGMPVADICRVTTTDPITARRVVDAHHRRLEAELATATARLADVRELLAATTSLTVDAAELRAALRSVRRAVGDHSSWRALRGVLFDVDDATLRLVATDRHRLAVSALPVTGVEGPPVRVIAPVTVVDAFLDRSETPRVSVSLAPGRVTLGGLDGTPIDAIYPDYRALLVAHESHPEGTRGQSPVAAGVAVTASDLLEQVIRAEAGSGLNAGPRDDLVTIDLDPSEVRIGDAPRTVAFDRKYLTDAVRSFGDADLRLTVSERDAIRLAAVHGPDAVVLLMPVRLDAHAA
ncbi:MerR family transcriptional regulator [Promicromonospora sp. NPDC023805]|uniref:DNA polymerase III subunit beta family protein n=1 Tax=Promicromonospora sp. NPDC023805 TaxID=3154696 RepID=UPI0033E1414A